MKPLLTLLMLLVLTGTAPAKNLSASFGYCTFYSPEIGPYVETYLNIHGSSVQYQRGPDGLYQSAVDVILLVEQSGKIVFSDKYKLLSPETADTLAAAQDFINQKRISLPNGNYKLELQVKDASLSQASPYTLIEDIEINFPANLLSLSDIELLSKVNPTLKENELSRNGVDLSPRVDNFYGSEENLIRFYAEAYYTATLLKNEGFLFSYFLENYEDKRIYESTRTMSRQNSKEVNPLLAQIDISQIPSGNYNLVLELRNRQNELLVSKSVFLQRSKGLQFMAESNPGDYRNIDISGTFVSFITSKDSISEYIRCLWPISSPNENAFALNQLEIADVKLMQQFFYDFWLRRNNTDPESAWRSYKEQVDKVNQLYSYGKTKGYNTDRGRVYLQYGAPNQIAQSYHEPDTYPYEIWQYYKIKTQTNRKFVFYNRDLLMKDFRLLHSDAMGETFEQQWQLMLKGRTEVIKDFDQRTPSENSYGNQFNNLYVNPR